MEDWTTVLIIVVSIFVAILPFLFEFGRALERLRKDFKEAYKDKFISVEEAEVILESMGRVGNAGVRIYKTAMNVILRKNI